VPPRLLLKLIATLLVPAGVAVAFPAAVVVTLAVGAVALRRVQARLIAPELEPV